MSEAVDTDVFVRRYLAHASTQLPGRPASSLGDLARAHLELGQRRAQRAILVEARDLDGETTAIDIVADDAPFLIDSLRAELDRSMHPIESVLHPQIVVVRDEDGRLIEVLDVEDTAQVPAGAIAEAWIHLEIACLPAAETTDVVADVRRVLDDVEHVGRGRARRCIT